MKDNTKETEKTKVKPEIIRIDEGEIRNHLDRIVRGVLCKQEFPSGEFLLAQNNLNQSAKNS